uniref:Pyridine nucleotide-disulfide oxidoreductase n=1 Tax=Fundidesulfovibrio putealis TaxID=270496 RepID=A0A7C4EMF1_9BACT
MGKHLLLLGGGHAHLTVLANLASYIDAGHRVTLVAPADYHYYSGMGPGMLSGHYRPQECRFHVRKLAERGGAVFIRSRAVRVEPDRNVVHLENGMAVGYDVCSCNTGSLVPPRLAGAGQKHVFPVKPIENLLAARQYLLDIVEREGRSPRVLVVGGGPAGVELAGNVCQLISCGCTETPNVSVAPGRGLLPRAPEKVRRLAYRVLAARGVRIFDGHTAARVDQDTAYLSGDLRVPCDAVLLAAGVVPQPDWSHFGLAAGPKGGLLVNRNLQSVSHPNVFGGGDCISFQPGELDKVGVYPVRQNPVLHHNLMAALDGRKPQPFTQTQGGYLLVLNCGDGRGILHKGWLCFEGRAAFWIKDYIDRKFMKMFQLCGEAAE